MRIYDGVGQEFIMNNGNNYIVLEETDSDVENADDC